MKYSGKIKSWAAVISVTATSVFCYCVFASGPFEVWVIGNMERAAPDDPPGKHSTATLYAARNEYEPFQIAVRAPAGGLTNINVHVTDLVSKDKNTIAGSNISLYREHYIYVGRSSPADPKATNRPLGPGRYADALIPFIDPATGKTPKNASLRAVPCDIAEGKNQPFWMDIFVPQSASPGMYHGEFVVSGDQGVVKGRIELNVWDFDLPLKPSLLSSFGNWSAPAGTEVELLRHRVMPFRVRPEDERHLIDTLGLTAVHAGIVSGADIKKCKMAPAPTAGIFAACSRRHQRDLFLYNYTADEINRCSNLVIPLKEWARNLHSAGLANLVTMTPHQDLYDDGAGTGRSAVDIWVLLPTMYEAAPRQVEEVKRKGDQVWFYTALAQDGYSPKWLLDFAPINYRIQQGFINQSMGLKGILYWKVNHWNSDPWNDPMSFRAGDNYFPGEGVLVYPGGPAGIDGVVPSMRLKWLREGVEDFEYIKMLKDRGKEQEALAVIRRISPDWRNWSKDPAEFEAARRELGELLSATPLQQNTNAH